MLNLEKPRPIIAIGLFRRTNGAYLGSRTRHFCQFFRKPRLGSGQRWNSRVKGLASNRFSGDRFTQWSSVNPIELPFPSRAVEWLITTRPCTTLKVRAASASLPTLFPSSTGSRLSPSSSRGAIHDMAQTGRSNVRYVDPQRRYTVVLGPLWNAPFEALRTDDRAGTHDSADGRCGSYASIGYGQAPRSVDNVEKFLSIRCCHYRTAILMTAHPN